MQSFDFNSKDVSPRAAITQQLWQGRSLLCSHILMSGRLLSRSPLTLVPHEDSAAEINLPDVGVEGEVPLRGLVVREPPIDLHQLHIVTVWNTWNIWKKYHAHSPLTYSWTAWTCRCGCPAGSERTPCRGRPPSRHSWTRDSWQLVTKDANGYKTAGVLSTRVRISVGMTVYRRLVSK